MFLVLSATKLISFIACNTSLQRLHSLISVMCQMHETEMISFVTICKAPQHSVIQQVLDNAVLHYPAKCQLPGNLSQIKLLPPSVPYIGC
jgi:hypothetical protein